MSQQQYAIDKLHAIKARISAAETQANRPPGSVTLIGASKQQTPDLINEFAHAGLTQLGENYLQESIAKQAEVNKHHQHLTWHFIGHIQSNKTKTIAQNFEWVHGVDRIKIARRLAEQNPKDTPLKLLIQLNVDNEASKHGVSLEQAGELANDMAQAMADYSKVQIKGFMAIPQARKTLDEQRAVFAKVQALLAHTNQRFGLSLEELSMGMSQDLEAAIAEGSTMVRIGTNLFGARK